MNNSVGNNRDEDDARHRREEQERRAKRKASKMSKSEDQLERDRQRREYRQNILKKHGAAPAAAKPGGSGKKRGGKGGSAGGASAASLSPFQELFQQRSTGFQVDFRFRNAPPRPPVGPTFCGRTLQAELEQLSRTYKALNAVEVSYQWKLHAEADLGVPLAPSAMDLKSYQKQQLQANSKREQKLHPDDAALLDWKGSMGDTAAENLKKRLDRAKAAARLALTSPGGAATSGPSPLGGVSNRVSPAGVSTAQLRQQQRSNKAFSRVLKESMQAWMRKTNYLSNDYSRKVHDFKSLAQTKQQQQLDLQSKQQLMDKKRSRGAIEESFALFDDGAATAAGNNNKKRHILRHPTRKHLKPKNVYSVLPNVDQWGRPYTHLVMDKQPALPQEKLSQFSLGMVAAVEQNQASAKMTCQLWVPAEDGDKDKDEDQEEKQEGDGDNDDNGNEKEKVNNKKREDRKFEPVHAFDLDVVPLKEEDAPHAHFCLWLDADRGAAHYHPISSRVKLSMGRPIRSASYRKVGRRPVTAREAKETEERMAEVDRDLAEKHDLTESLRRPVVVDGEGEGLADRTGDGESAGKNDEDDEGEDDFGDDEDDDDSADEQVFGGATKTIIAEG